MAGAENGEAPVPVQWSFKAEGKRTVDYLCDKQEMGGKGILQNKKCSTGQKREM